MWFAKIVSLISFERKKSIWLKWVKFVLKIKKKRHNSISDFVEIKYCFLQDVFGKCLKNSLKMSKYIKLWENEDTLETKRIFFLKKEVKQRNEHKQFLLAILTFLGYIIFIDFVTVFQVFVTFLTGSYDLRNLLKII